MSGTYAVNAKTAVKKFPKEKKMGWFSRWFDRKCREAWNRYNESDYPTPSRVQVAEESVLSTEGMNIRLHSATGGTIVEFRRYDRIKDRNDNKMYIIPTEQNFSEQFSKIVSMEMMR